MEAQECQQQPLPEEFVQPSEEAQQQNPTEECQPEVAVPETGNSQEQLSCPDASVDPINQEPGEVDCHLVSKEVQCDSDPLMTPEQQCQQECEGAPEVPLQ